MLYSLGKRGQGERVKEKRGGTGGVRKEFGELKLFLLFFFFLSFFSSDQHPGSVWVELAETIWYGRWITN